MKIVPTLLLIALVSTSCRSRVETKALSRPNPTSYSFAHPVPELHDLAMKAFSSGHQAAEPIFGRQTSPCTSSLSLESSDHAVFSEKIFRDPQNARDLYLHSFHDPIVRSAVYVGKEGNLPFIAAFHLHLQAAGPNETLVSVTALDAEVIAGEHFGIGSCGPGMANTYRSVPPTTVEEYTVLRYLGNYLGMTNMPAVIRPATN